MIKKGIFDIELGLIIPIGILVVFGLATLLPINFVYFRTQLFYIIISIFAFFFFSNVNYKIFKLYSKQIYVLSIFVLAVVLLLGIESRGAVRWIDVFGIRIQFSEILKPFLAISFSSYIANIKNQSFGKFLASIIFSLPIFLLVYLQPDLGNALIYLTVFLITLLVSGFSISFFLLSFFIMLLSSPLFWFFMKGYQKQRILTFLDLSKDPLGTSYNAIQSIMAVGSGMLFGRGLTGSTQSALRFLPERHTDFIFATLSEEFGLLGSLIIIIAFAFLLYKIFLIFTNSEDKFCKIFSATSFFLILIQLFVNIGMNIGIVPIVGVTLPFVSYGGSSILSSFILFGFLSSISKDQKGQDILEIK